MLYKLSWRTGTLTYTESSQKFRPEPPSKHRDVCIAFSKTGVPKKPWNNCSCLGTFTIFEHTITYPTYIQYIDLYKGYKGCLFHNPLPQQKQVFLKIGGWRDHQHSPTNYLIDIASTNLKITYHWRSRILPTSMSFTSRTSSITSKSVQRKGGEKNIPITGRNVSGRCSLCRGINNHKVIHVVVTCCNSSLYFYSLSVNYRQGE